MKCISTLKSADASVVDVCVGSIHIVVVVYDGPAVGYVGVVVENYGVVAPVRDPTVPAPAKAAKETNSKASAKCDAR